MKSTILKLLIVLFLSSVLVSFCLCQEEEASSTAAATTKAEEEEEEPPKKGCSIWCWIQKIAMFVISQLLSGN